MGKGEFRAGREIGIPTLDNPDDATGNERIEHVLLLLAAQTRIDQQLAETLGVVDENHEYELLAYSSAVAMLKHEGRMSGSRANRYIFLARAAHSLKATFLSWKHNHISTDQAELLFQAVRTMPDKYPDAEPVLLETVGDDCDETRKVLDYWRNTVDKPGVLVDERAQLERRRLDIGRKANGMVEGELACDSSVSRIVWNAESEVIDVGRKTRVIPAATRPSLIARDRHCAMSGCGRNPRWCDAHHIEHWADGGATDVDNLCLLCRYHHTMVHQGETMELLLLEQINPPEIARSI